MRSTVGIMLAGIALSGCDIMIGGAGIRGSGVKATESRDVPEFNAIDTRGSADVQVDVGKEQSLTIEIDDNLLDVITTEVKGNTLVIGSKESFRSRIGLTATITVPKLESVSISGSGDVQVSGIDGEGFDLVINGSGDARASGTAERVKVKINGSGDVNLSDLVAQAVTVEIAGSGDVRVHATDKLRASILGSGDIRYRGNPKIERTILGSGDISKEQ